MEDWKKGDITICIKDDLFDFQIKKGIQISPPVRLHGEYIVHNKYQCPQCNKCLLDIGLKSNNTTKNTICQCGEIVPCKEIHWINADRFKKKIIKSPVEIPFLEDDK